MTARLSTGKTCQHSTASTARGGSATPLRNSSVIPTPKQQSSYSKRHSCPQSREAFPPPSTPDPPVGIPRAEHLRPTTALRAAAAAAAASLIPPSHQPQHESSPAPAAWLIPARIIPCGFPAPEGRPKLAPFFPPSIDSHPPVDSAQSSHRRSRSRIPLGAARRRRPVQASAPRLAIFSPPRRCTIPRYLAPILVS